MNLSNNYLLRAQDRRKSSKFGICRNQKCSEIFRVLIFCKNIYDFFLPFFFSFLLLHFFWRRATCLAQMHIEKKSFYRNFVHLNLFVSSARLHTDMRLTSVRFFYFPALSTGRFAHGTKCPK